MPSDAGAELVPPAFLTAQYVDAFALEVPDSPVRLNGGNSCRWLADVRVGDALERQSSVAGATRKQGRSGTLDIFDIATVYRRIDTGREVAKLGYTAIRSYPVSQENVRGPERANAVPDDASLALFAAASPRQVVAYAVATEDLYEAHYDADFAREREFDGPIVHGTLKMAWFARAALQVAGPDYVVEEIAASYRGTDLVKDEFFVSVRTSGPGDAHADRMSLEMFGGTRQGHYSTIGSAVLRRNRTVAEGWEP
jgi:acyl dehydratase